MCRFFIFVLAILNIYSEQLIYSNSSFVFNQNYLEDIKKKEKLTKANYIKIEKEKYKNLESELKLQEKSPNKYISETNTIFVNSEYKIIPEPNTKNSISINEKPFLEFDKPFSINEEGEFKLIHRVNSGKEIIEKKENLFLDNFKPSLEIGIQGVFVVKDSIPYFNQKIKLVVETSDIGSGVSNIYVKLNHDPYIPFSALGNKLNKLGLNKVTVIVADNVGNLSKEESLNYYIDKKAPELEISTNNEVVEEKEELYCEKGSKIFLNGKDSGIGLKKIMYRKNGKDWKEYKNKGFRVIKDLFLEIQTEDELGNSNLEKFSCKVK